MNNFCRSTSHCLFGLLVFGSALSIAAQSKQDAGPINLVLSKGKGRIALPASPDLQLQKLEVADKGERPVAQFSTKDGLTVSYILFRNLSGDDTGKDCREDVFGPLLRKLGPAAMNLTRGDEGSMATASYLIETAREVAVHQQNLFGFWGDAKTCAEVHVSKVAYKPTDDPQMHAALTAVTPDLKYVPTDKDYSILADMLFAHAPATAAPYYQSALAVLPNDPETLAKRRTITKQLLTSYKAGGDFEARRAVLEAAVAHDPDYPLYYYNLARADAEQGDAASAKAHLQAAFERKDNLIQGESMPNPEKDVSLMKLEENKPFWDYVKSLSSGAHKAR